MYTCVLPTVSFSRLFVQPSSDDTNNQLLRRYYAVVPIAHIPQDWARWTEVNARDASDKGKVPNAILGTLSSSPESFATFNRGLTVVAGGVEYENQTKNMTLKFVDSEYHGVLDGGHTLRAILNHRAGLDGNTQEGYCNIEIFTGLPEREIPAVVEARNTSKQVASKSLMNLEGSFDGLKNALGSKSDLITWKENEDGEIDVREVIAILTALDPSYAADGSQPIPAYSGKEACLKRFSVNKEAYEKLYGIAGTALKMWDSIQYYLPGQYNQKGPEPGTSGKFGRLTGVTQNAKRPQQLPFIGKMTEYSIPNGYMYPVLSAFRAMLVEQDNGWAWGKGIDPIEAIKEGVASDIFIRSVRESINNYRNPNRIGKDVATWTTAYLVAENYFLRLPMI